MKYINGYKEKNKYKVLSKKDAGKSSELYLIDCGENFFAYGFKRDIQSLYFVPVSQCGTKEEVKSHCESIVKLCKKNIKQYEKEMIKDNSEGWKMLIKNEKKELEALTCFIEILS